MCKGWLFLAAIMGGWLAVAAPAFAQDAPCDPGVEPPRCQLGMDYLFFRIKAASFPPLASTGNASDPIPGALGNPDTRLLGAGDIDHGWYTGGRFYLAYWFTDDRNCCLESNVLLTEQRSRFFGFASDGSTGSQVLVRPFFDPVLQQESVDPRALPDQLAGTINFSYTTRLLGAEVNARYDFEGVGRYLGSSLSFLVGARYLRLDEKYIGQDTTTFLPESTGDSFFFTDNFTTYNQFIAPQVGLRLRYRWDPEIFLDVGGKVAVGPNSQHVEISGLTTITDAAGNVTATGNQGLFAQPTNVGRYDRDVIAWLPELSVNLGYDVTENFRLKVGYTFFYLSKVVRPGDQIDRVVNIQAVGVDVPGPPFRPAFAFRQSSFWGQFFNLGVEFTF